MLSLVSVGWQDNAAALAKSDRDIACTAAHSTEYNFVAIFEVSARFA